MKTISICAVGLSLLTAISVFADDKAVPILDGVFQVENDQSAFKSVTVKTLEYHPDTSAYVVRGRVQYRHVEGIAYLEMWNIMPDGSRFFSRTLGDDGPMRKIHGTSDWREFELPFFLSPYNPESVTLEINVVMPGKGTIELSGLTISSVHASEWWGSRTGGIAGGLLGTLVGVYGALIGCLCGYLAPRGKGRRWVTGLFYIGITFGVFLFLVGLTALCLSQPWHVWYPLILTGGLMIVIFPPLLLKIRLVYTHAERRRMEALDV